MPSDGGGETPVRLAVRLLGAVEVVLDGERLSAFDSPRLQRFLALIALRREPQHRARLAFELWPDSNEAQARTNLRKLLHELRRSMPEFAEFIETRDETMRLSPTGAIEVDVWRFREAIAVGDLELAARLYAGDLLPACYDDWVLNEREVLRTEAYRALTQLAVDTAGRDGHEDTIRHCHGILNLEPTDETAVRLLMEAHVALGDRAAALRTYHRCVETLERELSLTPGEAIGTIYRSLRASASDPVEVPDEHFEPIAESPFVGRDVELQRLREAWNSAREGRAQVLLVTGEPGIGKSRLALEFSRHVRAEGHDVASARAYEAAGRLPWAPVIDLLRSDDLRGHVDSLDALRRTELSRLMPELLDAPDLTGPRGPSELAQRYRLFDAVSRALVGERPRLLIVDDLQWCDRDTLEMIGFVVRSERAAPLLVVGTVRSEQIPEDHPLSEVVEALSRDRAVTTLPLARLDEAATVTLAARLGGAEMADAEMAARLWGETEGNPLFIIEAFRAGFADGGGHSLLTPTIRSVLLGRLSRLPDGARRVAEVAAVIGRPFSVGLMASATGLGEDEVVDHVDELWRRRIVRDQGPTFDFSHDKLRAVALETVSPARRRQIHRAVAEAMAAEIHDGDAPAQLAAHFDQAGMIEPAVDAYLKAGARAVEVSALDEALTMFRRALALLADVPPSPGRDASELELRIALGSPLVALEGYGSEDAHRLYERARLLCRRLNRPVDPPILRGLGLARLQGCRFDDSAEFGQALLDHESHDPVARTEGRYLLGVSAFWRGDLLVARRSLERAVSNYDVSHRNQHLALYAQDPKAVCLVRLAWVELWAGDVGASDATARSALAVASEVDHLMTSAYVVTYAAIMAAESEDLARLATLLDDLQLVWDRLPTPYLMVVGDALRGWLEVCEGSAAGVERIVRSVARSRAKGETLHLTYCLLLLARTRGVTDEFRQGRAATREALEWLRGNDQHYLEAELLRVDGELAHRDGDPGAAAASLRDAVEVADAQGADWLKLRALLSLVGRFPERAAREQLEELVQGISGRHDLPVFRAARSFLRESD